MKSDEKEITFSQEGYLKKSYLGADGEKHVTFEFAQSSALEVAKLELMSRDGHRHALLEVTVRISPNHGKAAGRQGVYGKPRQKHSNGRRESTDT